MNGVWPERRVKYLVTKIGSGKTPRGGASAYAKDGVMLLRSQNVHFDGIRLDDVAFIDEETDEEMASTRVRPHDVLLNITGASIGRCAVAPPSIGCANVNQHVCILRPDTKRVEPRYLNFAFQSAPVQQAIFSGERGSSREGLTFEQIGGLTIPVPTASRQHIIADYLDRETERLDALVAAKERLLELLAEKRLALITHTVTRGLDPHAPLRDSGIPWLGEIPAHWQVLKIAWLFKERDQRGEPELPLLEVSLKAGVVLREFTGEKIESTAADFNTYKVARKGDVVFNKMRMWQGAVGIAPEDGLASPDYVVAKQTGSLAPNYAGLLLRTSAFSAESARRSHGIVWDRLRLYWEGFRDIEVPVPPEAEQLAIVKGVEDRVERLDDLRSAAEVTLSLLRERRSALIAGAVTGQIDVGVGA